MKCMSDIFIHLLLPSLAESLRKDQARRMLRQLHPRGCVVSTMAAAIVLSIVFLSAGAASPTPAKSSTRPPPAAGPSPGKSKAITPPSPVQIPPFHRSPVPPSPPSGYLTPLPRDVVVRADMENGTITTLPDKKLFRLHVFLSYEGLLAANQVSPRRYRYRTFQPVFASFPFLSFPFLSFLLVCSRSFQCNFQAWPFVEMTAPG